MLDELARAAGIADSYTDYFGRDKLVSRETKRAILAAMGFDARSDRQAARTLHELRAGEDARKPHSVQHCAYVPPSIERDGIWGYALQLYSLRSRRNWGIGDFGDLAQFVRTAHGLGAEIVGLNPLHQLQLGEPAAASPYSPLSRLHLNALYIDVDAAWETLGFGSPQMNPAVLASLRDAALVEYPDVAREKVSSLRELYARFAESPTHGHRASFEAFRKSEGAALRRMAVYEALTAYFKERDASVYGWMQWPQQYLHPRAKDVAAFARNHLRQVQFYEFLQWLAVTQLRRAADAASRMAIGLYRDLAIGVAANSVDVWSDLSAYCLGLSIGAPPDALNTEGQNWGLPPLDPHKLREGNCRAFAQILRANMRCAGALRIDHVMGLQRLYLIPDGAPAIDGAYVAYPFDDLVAVLTHESQKKRCLIVGEDLGTVPPGFRERMAQARIFSCRLLFFERNQDGSFRDPATYPRDAAASTGTHDLPPLLGFEESLSEIGRDELHELARAGKHEDDCAFACGTYRALGRTSARVLLVQMEDALLRREAVNVPGTTTEHPNWRRKLPRELESLQDDACFVRLARAVSESR